MRSWSAPAALMQLDSREKQRQLYNSVGGGNVNAAFPRVAAVPLLIGNYFDAEFAAARAIEFDEESYLPAA
jgi:hypothetical protein